MSAIRNMGVLAFASAALAVPHAQWQPFKRHGHGHAHMSDWGSESWGSDAPSGSAVSPASASSGMPFPAGNMTGAWGTTGTGGPTAAPTSICTETSTMIFRTSTEYSTYYVTHTLSPVPYASTSSVASAVDAASSSAEECTAADVTVTTTERTTVTVTAGGDSSSSVAAAVGSSSSSPSPVSPAAYTPPSSSAAAAPSTSSSDEVAPTSPAASTPSSSSVYVAPSSAEAAPSSSSVYVAPSSSSAWVAPSSSMADKAAAPSSYAAPVSSILASATSAVASAASSILSSAAPSSSRSSGASGSKRGLAYNDAALCDSFTGSSNFGYAYNWGSDASGFTSSSIQYIPMLWGTASMFTDGWSANAQKGIDNGAEYLFSFNEPDMDSQSNMSPQAAADAWMTYMEPFAGKAKLCAPSVTNGQGTSPLMGLDWLSEFLDACSGCTIDCVNQHWYDSTSNNNQYFQQQVSNATTVSGGKPVFVTEFGAIGSDDDISDFLQEVMPWMDGQDNVLGYFYYMVSDGLLVDGTEPSSYGATYMNYS